MRVFQLHLQPLEQTLNMEFAIQLNDSRNISEGQIQYIKENTLAESVKRIKEEQKVFFPENLSLRTCL